MKKLTRIFQTKVSQLIIVALVAIISYINILPNGFVWDDKDFILDWPQIKSTEGLPAYLTLPDLLAGDLPERHRGIYRPLRSVFYLVSYNFFGENPVGYHIQAIIIQALISMLIYLIAEIITGKRLAALIIGVLFASHPIHTEAVTFITASFDTIGILFFFLSFYLYLKMKSGKAKKTRYFIGSVIYSVFAIFTYESTLVLPLLIILYDFCFNNFSFKKLYKNIRFYKYYIYGFLAYFLARLLLEMGNRADYLGNPWLIAAYQARTGMPEIVLNYLQWLLWPVGLTNGQELPVNFLNAFIELVNKIEPTGRLVNLSANHSYIFPVFYITLALFLTFKLLRRWPTVIFAASWFFISLIPVSSIIPQGASLAARFLYIPSFGFSLISGFFLYYLFQRLKTQKAAQYCIAGITLLITVFYIGNTIKRNTEYRDYETLWYAAIREYPKYYRPYAALGIDYLHNKKYNESLTMLKKAVELSPENAQIISDLGLAYEQVGDIDKAVEQHQKALKFDPSFIQAYVALGNIYQVREQYDLAEKEYQQVLQNKKDDPLVFSALGNSLYFQEKYDAALSAYKQALELNPYLTNINLKIGMTYVKQLKFDKAIEVFETALEISKKDPQIYLELANAYLQKREKNKAIETLKKGLEDTGDQKIKDELGIQLKQEN